VNLIASNDMLAIERSE